MWYIYMCVCVTYVHNPESTWKILLARLKKGEMVGLVNLAIDTLDLSLTKKTAAGPKAKGKKPGSTCSLLGYLQTTSQIVTWLALQLVLTKVMARLLAMFLAWAVGLGKYLEQ